MKKLDKEFFIIYSVDPIDFYDSAIGVENLAKIFKRTRANMLRALKNKYLLLNNKKYMIIRESDLNSN